MNLEPHVSVGDGAFRAVLIAGIAFGRQKRNHGCVTVYFGYVEYDRCCGLADDGYSIICIGGSISDRCSLNRFPLNRPGLRFGLEFVFPDSWGNRRYQ